MSTDHELTGDYGDQLALLSDVPQGGQLYRNRHTAEIATVVTVNVRHRPWITYRSWGKEHQVDLQHFEQHWQPCRPDGSLL